MFKLSPLPYDFDALAPHISEATLKVHYGKHHQGYVDKLNAAVEGTELEGTSLEEIIQAAREKPDQGLFNNAAQVWNHDFFWKSMSPDDSKPSDDLAAAIEKAFGDTDGFKKAFKEAATGRFGSGWAWLVADSGTLEVESTGNAELPLALGSVPLICCDVWEHAYYLDYQNRRPDFVDAFLDHLIDWDFASRNWQAA
tara:strand:+ start:3369 stop:3959 length:591 start_codon:yes stop_codon:yes gene_type:complete